MIYTPIPNSGYRMTIDDSSDGVPNRFAFLATIREVRYESVSIGRLVIERNPISRLGTRCGTSKGYRTRVRELSMRHRLLSSQVQRLFLWKTESKKKKKEKKKA